MKLKYLLFFLMLKGICLKSYPIQDAIWKSANEESIIRVVGMSDDKNANDKEVLDSLVNCIYQLDHTKQKHLVIVKQIDTQYKSEEDENVLERLSNFINYLKHSDKVNIYTPQVSYERLPLFYDKFTVEHAKRMSPIIMEGIFHEKAEIIRIFSEQIISLDIDFGTILSCKDILNNINSEYKRLKENLQTKAINDYSDSNWLEMVFTDIKINIKSILDNVDIFSFTYAILNAVKTKRNVLMYCDNNLATEINRLFTKLQFTPIVEVENTSIEKPLEIDIINKNNQIFLDLTNT